MAHEFFTLGGAIARVWKPAYPLLPWALSSALLMTAGVWDCMSRGGPVEWIVVGLAAYELMFGLLESAQRPIVSAGESISPAGRASRASAKGAG